jgi:hypothetical protein
MFVCPDCGHSQPSPGPCPSDQTALLPRGDDAILGTSVGVYRIAKLLGVGGMGRVYKGVHPQIGSRVAVKVLSRECADRADLVERFFSEALRRLLVALLIGQEVEAARYEGRRRRGSSPRRARSTSSATRASSTSSICRSSPTVARTSSWSTSTARRWPTSSRSAARCRSAAWRA